MFPLANSVAMALFARDSRPRRQGHSRRAGYAPLTDITRTWSRRELRMRLALYTVGPSSGRSLRSLLMTSARMISLVFWIASIPGAIRVAVAIFGVTERAEPADNASTARLRRQETFSQLPRHSGGRRSDDRHPCDGTVQFPAFLVLKMTTSTWDAAFVRRSSP